MRALRRSVLPTDNYTAFGDPVTPDGQGGWRVGWPIGAGGIGVPPVTRYQYDGGWGYESGLISLFGEDETLPPVTLQHVGWRWYQPSLGRFIQRDPIGLRGGLNLYEYARSSPLSRVDRRGTGLLSHLWEVIKETIKEVFVPAPVAPVEVAGEGAQICVAVAVRSHALKGDAADLDDDGLDEYEKWHGVAYEDDPPPAPPPPAPSPSPDPIDWDHLVLD